MAISDARRKATQWVVPVHALVRCGLGAPESSSILSLLGCAIFCVWIAKRSVKL